MASATDIIEGLTILSQYTNDGLDSQVGGASHDVIFGPCVDEDEVSVRHLTQLREFGWHYSSEFDCWARFV